jgi:hypothetical protein
VITEHTICALPEDHRDYRHFAIKVVYRGDNLWAVTNSGNCLDVDGEWDYEPSPSSRDDGWLATHRFDEQTALRLAEEHAPLMTCNGLTVADVLERGQR